MNEKINQGSRTAIGVLANETFASFVSVTRAAPSLVDELRARFYSATVVTFQSWSHADIVKHLGYNVVSRSNNYILGIHKTENLTILQFLKYERSYQP